MPRRGFARREVRPAWWLRRRTATQLVAVLAPSDDPRSAPSFPRSCAAAAVAAWYLYCRRSVVDGPVDAKPTSRRAAVRGSSPLDRTW
jgi:hypothetical protein